MTPSAIVSVRAVFHPRDVLLVVREAERAVPLDADLLVAVAPRHVAGAARAVISLRASGARGGSGCSRCLGCRRWRRCRRCFGCEVRRCRRCRGCRRCRRCVVAAAAAGGGVGSNQPRNHCELKNAALSAVLSGSPLIASVSAFRRATAMRSLCVRDLRELIGIASRCCRAARSAAATLDCTAVETAGSSP